MKSRKWPKTLNLGHFGPKMASKSLRHFFFGHGVNTKVVDIGLVDLNMENEQNLMKQTRETGQKPHFGPDLGTFGPI